MILEHYLKALNVILSCENLEQLIIARKYLKLLYKGETNIPNIMLETQFIIKVKHLEGIAG